MHAIAPASAVLVTLAILSCCPLRPPAPEVLTGPGGGVRGGYLRAVLRCVAAWVAAPREAVAAALAGDELPLWEACKWVTGGGRGCFPVVLVGGFAASCKDARSAIAHGSFRCRQRAAGLGVGQAVWMPGWPACIASAASKGAGAGAGKPGPAGMVVPALAHFVIIFLRESGPPFLVHRAILALASSHPPRLLEAAGQDVLGGAASGGGGFLALLQVGNGPCVEQSQGETGKGARPRKKRRPSHITLTAQGWHL